MPSSVDEPRWRALAAAAFEGVALLDDGVIIECNDALVEMLRGDRAQILGRHAIEFVVARDHKRVASAIDQESSAPYETTGLRCDGSQFPAEIRGRLAQVDGHHMRVSAVRDLSEQRRTESRYSRLFEAAGDGIMIMDGEAKPLEVNARLCDMLGYSREQVLGMSADQGIADLGDNPMQLSRLRDEDRYVISRQLRHASGNVVDVEVSVTRLGPGEVLAVVRDTSDRVRAQEEEAALRRRLARSERMESLGRLAGGVAHDFNNLLTVIIGNVELLRREGVSADRVNQIDVASQRAADLTRQLLAFGRQPVVRLQVMDPNAAVDEASGLLRRLLGEDYVLEVQLDGSVEPICGDVGQFTQVILNLAVNARDAMPEGGKIQIRTLRQEREGLEGLQLSVTDRGPGIAPEDRERIFEPFYTSKAPGQGTGLGLATVFGIVSRAGGTIEVTDVPGGGSTFVVYWPAATEVASDPSDAGESALTQKLRILLVEDDAAVRSVVERALVEIGHQVTALSGPGEALGRGTEFVEQFDLLLSDVVMPEMDGPTLARELGAQNVVFMSGYPGDALSQRGLSVDPERVLEKPFSTSALARTLARAAVNLKR